MKTIYLQQGSPEWLTHRRTTRNASDAPAMMGVSPYVTRSELLRQYATGVAREIDDATQRRFDRGHDVEPALRAFAERLIDDDLYPVTGISDDSYLGASFDGVTLDETMIIEAKQHNATKIASMAQSIIPPSDYWQIVQQFAVCDTAERCLFLCGDGTEQNTNFMFVARHIVAGDIPKLLAGWQQFDADVAAYQPNATAQSAAGTAPDALPALSVIARGMVEFSNLTEFREKALDAISKVNRDLQSDDDFATAELTIKAFKAGEERLDATKAQILGQMGDIDAVMRTIDEVSAELRRVRLDLDKQVRVEKENRKSDIVQAGTIAVRAHYDTLNASLGECRIHPPQSLVLDIGSAIKGKKSLASMKDAVDTAVAGIKIAASEQAERVRANVAILAAQPDNVRALFADRVQLCATKAPEDLRNLVAARINEHQQRETARLESERERIRQEEVDRFERARTQASPANVQQHTPRAVEAEQPPTAAGGGKAGSTGALRAAGEPGIDIAETAHPSARIKLGDINDRIAPISISADGLRMIGFLPVAKERNSTLYRACDFPLICEALAQVLHSASQKLAA